MKNEIKNTAAAAGITACYVATRYAVPTMLGISHISRT